MALLEFLARPARARVVPAGLLPADRQAGRRGAPEPVAAHHDGVRLTALVADEDGAWVERRTGDDPVALGEELARLASS